MLPMLDFIPNPNNIRYFLLTFSRWYSNFGRVEFVDMAIWNLGLAVSMQPVGSTSLPLPDAPSHVHGNGYCADALKPSTWKRSMTSPVHAKPAAHENRPTARGHVLPVPHTACGTGPRVPRMSRSTRPVTFTARSTPPARPLLRASTRSRDGAPAGCAPVSV